MGGFNTYTLALYSFVVTFSMSLCRYDIRWSSEVSSHPAHTGSEQVSRVPKWEGTRTRSGHRIHVAEFRAAWVNMYRFVYAKRCYTSDGSYSETLTLSTSSSPPPSSAQAWGLEV